MTLRTRSLLRIERLEAREVPAVFIGNPATASYTDEDGDLVTIKVSIGSLAALNFTTTLVNGRDQLQKIDLSGGGFDNANLTVSVAKVPGGDGLANVGYIDSTGHDLGNVTVKGDLGQIDAGDAITATLGLKSLSVRSLGRLGADTQAGGGNLVSGINGALGALRVAGDVKDALVRVSGGPDGKIGSITIGGSLIGGSNDSSGQITCSGDMGVVKIGHDVQGGSANQSGFIYSLGKLVGVSIGGSLIGGSNSNSGLIVSDLDMGAVKIGHDVQGGLGSQSGFIYSSGKLASVSIGGSLFGASGRDSGKISSAGDMGPVKIGGNVHGGDANGTLVMDTGTIQGKRIASLTVGGSIIAGHEVNGGTLVRSGSVHADWDIGPLSVRGSLIGNAGNPVIITAIGQEVPTATVDLAVKSLTVGGRVEFATIQIGYTMNSVGKNADAQIGPVRVGGDWAASYLLVGVNPVDGKVGNGDDIKLAGNLGAGPVRDNNPISRIASIMIRGEAYGSPNSVSSADHFGFVAQQIGSLKVGGRSFALTAGLDSLAVGVTGDLRVLEVAQ